MVEAVDLVAAQVERADQAAEVVRGLVHGDADALPGEPVGRGEAEDAASDDADGGRHPTSSSPTGMTAGGSSSPADMLRRAATRRA